MRRWQAESRTKDDLWIRVGPLIFAVNANAALKNAASILRQVGHHDLGKIAHQLRVREDFQGSQWTVCDVADIDKLYV